MKKNHHVYRTGVLAAAMLLLHPAGTANAGDARTNPQVRPARMVPVRLAEAEEVPSVAGANEPAVAAAEAAEAKAASTPATPPPAEVAVPIIANPETPEEVVAAAMKGKRLYSFQADGMELKSALAAFARANNLNIVPDNDVSGTVTLDVRDLPLDLMMRAMLEAADCSWHAEGGLIRVRNTETRTFTVNYLRLTRSGMGFSSAMLTSGSTQGGGMGGGSMGGGGGMGGGSMGGGGGGMGGMGGGMGGGGAGGSSVNVQADNEINFWKELKEELGFVLTESGKKSLAINMTAGILQVTDRPSALKRVESYLKNVDVNVQRQVDIEARIYDVTLNDQFQFGIDWIHVAKAYGGAIGYGAATMPVAVGSSEMKDSALGSLGRNPGSLGSLVPGNNLSSLVFSNFNTRAAVTALATQGDVEVIAKPRLRTMNNQTALIKVGQEVPFFSQSTTYLPGTTSGTTTTLSETDVTSVTVGAILSMTPHVAEDDFVSMDISPVLTSLRGVLKQGDTTAPNLDTKQASTIIRVHDGNTIVLGGLIQTEKSNSENKIPLLGDIPLLGKLFTGTYRFKGKRELVIFVTPRIVRENEPSVMPIGEEPELRRLK